MDLRDSLDCTPRKGPPTPSQPSRRPMAPVDSKLLHLQPSAGAAPDAAALALALHADTDALAVQLEGRMAGVLAGYRELNDLASAAPKALGDFAAELSSAARDIAEAGREYGVAGYSTAKEEGNDQKMQGLGGMYGYSDSHWRDLGGPLDVERLMSEVHAANATHRALVHELAVPPPLPLQLGRAANDSSRRGSDEAFLGLPLPGSVPHGLNRRAAGGSNTRRTSGAARSSFMPSFPARRYNKENIHSDTGAGRRAPRGAGRDARGRHLDTAVAPTAAALGPIPIPKFQPSSSFSSGQDDAENEDNNAGVHGRAKGGASSNVEGGPHGGGSSNHVNAAPGGRFSSQFHTAKSAAAAEAARSRAAAAGAGAAGRGWSKSSGQPLVAFGTANAASDAAAAARTAPSSSATKGPRRTRSKRKKARPGTATTHEEGGKDEATGNNKDDAGIADKSSPKSASGFDAKQEPMHSGPDGEIHGNAANSRSMDGIPAADRGFPASGFDLGQETPPVVHDMTPPPPSPVVGPAGLPEEPLYKVITPRLGRTTIVRLPSYASHTQDEDDKGASAGADSGAGDASASKSEVQAPRQPPHSCPSKKSSSKSRSNASAYSAPSVPAVDSAATATATASASAAAIDHADGSTAAPATTATNSGAAAGFATVESKVTDTAGAGASVGTDVVNASGAGVTLYPAKGDVTWMAGGANYGAHSYNARPSEVPGMVELTGAGSSSSDSTITGAWNSGPEVGTRWTSTPIDDSSSSCVPGWPDVAKEGKASPWYASEGPSGSNDSAIRTNGDSHGISSVSPASPPPVSSSNRELRAEPLTPTEEDEEEDEEKEDGKAPMKPTTPQEPQEAVPSEVSTCTAPHATGADNALGSTAKAGATPGTSTATAPAERPTEEGAMGANDGSTEQIPHLSGANVGASGSTSSTTEALSEAELDLITLLVLKGLADQGKDPTSSNDDSSSSAGWIANPPWPALAYPSSHYPGDDGSNDHFQSASAATAAVSEQRAQAAEFAKASAALLTLVQEALVSGRAALDKERDLLARETALSRREVHGKQKSRSSTAVEAVQEGSGGGGGNAADSLAFKGSSNHSQDQHQDKLTSEAAASVVGQEQNEATAAAAALRESVRAGVREGLTSGLRESLQREMRFAWMQSGYAGSSVYDGDFNNRNSGDHHDDNTGGIRSGVAGTAEDYDNEDNEAHVAWFGNSGVARGRNLRESVRASVVASFEAGAAHTAAAAGATTLHGSIRGNPDSSSGASGHPQESGSVGNGEASFGGASNASAEAVAAAKERAEPRKKDGRLLAAETGSITTAGGSSVSTNATFKSNWGRMLQGGSRWRDEVPPADH